MEERASRDYDKRIAEHIGWSDPHEIPPFSSHMNWALVALERAYPESIDQMRSVALIYTAGTWSCVVALMQVVMACETGEEFDRNTATHAWPAMAICDVVMQSTPLVTSRQ